MKRKMKTMKLLLVAMVFILPAFRSGATTFYVNASNTVPASPFITWDTAATNIQDAIDASTNGDLVLVTNGVYQFGGRVMAGDLTNRVALNKAITVQSVNGPWVTIIQGLGVPSGSSAVRCAWLTNGASLVGFTLQGGGTRAPSADDNVASGGGAWCLSTSATIANCVIQSNTYYYHGAVFQGTLNNCLFRQNNGVVYGASVVSCTVVSNAGSGLYSCRATNCIVAYNAVSNISGIFSYSCTPSAVGGVGNINADPQLLADGIHLAATSPCIGAGTNLSTGTDINGQAWNNPPSMGCAEWQPVPLFITQPYYQVFSDSRSLLFNVSMAGQPPFTYFWFKDGNLVQDNEHYTNSNTSNLIVSSYGASDSGNYFVIASNVFGMATSQVAQVVIHCADASGTNPVAPYSTWATAATNIQDAINVASAGEIVLVTNGIYSSGGKVMAGDLTNRIAINKAMLVQSINGPTVTTIQGSGAFNGPTAVRCAWMTNGATLYGFTIQGGATRTNGDNTALQSGGGILCSSTQSFIDNCIIRYNSAYYNGGGVYSGNLRNCALFGNTIIGNPKLLPSGYGGGANGSTMNNCTVVGNWSSGMAGGCENGNFTNCIVMFNSSQVSSSPGNPGTNYAGGSWQSSCVTPLPSSGSGNISNDPQIFVDNIHLASTSPCRGTGTNTVSPADIYGNTWSNPPSMGCAEWVQTPFAATPAIQINNSGKVTVVVPVAGQPPFVCWWMRNGVPIVDGGDFNSGNTTNLLANNLNLLVGASFQVVVSNAYGVATSPAVTFTIHCVDVAATNPVAPYSTWVTAATNIQDAITASAVGDVVLVTNGLYATGGKSMDGTITNRIAVDKAILVQSVNGPNSTVIQGAWDSTSTNGPGAMRCAWLTNNAILSGFTLCGGATRSVTSSPNQTMDGGGVLGNSNNATVYNCFIATNYASYIGGGAYQVTLNQCTLMGNHAVGSGQAGAGVAGAGAGGGAVNCNLNNCVITSNFAAQSYGGGAQNCNSTNCVFTLNKTTLYGSAAYQGSLVNCTVNNNTSGGYGAYGGAVASATLINCIVYGNYNIGSGATNYYSCTFSYSDTDPLPTGTGNLDVDPQFLADGIHLAATSPCIGAGTASVVSGTDIYGQSWNNPPSIGCVEWQPAPVICAAPTYQVNLPAGSLTFNVSVAGQPPFSYFWSKDGTAIEDDAYHTNSGTANLVLQPLQSALAGNYQVVVSNVFGVATSSIVTATMAYPPGIVVFPTNTKTTNGGSANFSVTAMGTQPYSYQWYFNNLALAGGTNATFTIGNVGSGQIGNYFCVITNNYGSITSRIVSLAILFPPAIITQPSNQTACIGSNAVLGVAVSGTGPFTYQWQLNGMNLPNNLITTVAGNGFAAFSGDGGAATNASLNMPWFATMDASGDLFVSDYNNDRIRKVDTNGIITTVAGNGKGYFHTNGIAATNSAIICSGVAVDDYGNLFIADVNFNNHVHKVDTNGIVSNFVGSGSRGYSGDGGAATNATISFPNGLAVDGMGNLFIADNNNNRIRKVDLNGIISTVAGVGPSSNNYSGDGGAATNAGLNYPNGVAVDAAGVIFIVDCSNNRIRKVDTNGIITTVAGNGTNGYSGDGGVATNGSLSGPRDVKVDAAGNIYIADYGNSRIRMVDTNGIITTVAGNGTNTYSGDGGTATNASLYNPTGVALDAAGNLFIVDYRNSRIRKVALGGTPILALNNINLTNAGNYSVVISNPSGSVTSSVATINLQLPPVTSAFTASNKLCNFNWSAVTSQTYMLQYATNLATPNWIDLGNPITATGNVAATADAPSGTGQRFYRIRLWP